MAATWTWPRPTAQDIREGAVTRGPAYDALWRIMPDVPCEHDYRLTDSCPLCDYVDERLDDMSPAARRAYFAIVAHGAAHLAPTPLNHSTCRALARAGLVDWYTLDDGARPALVWSGLGRNASRWTAVPTGHTAFTDGYTATVGALA